VTRRRLFVDASAFIAIADPSDRYHDEATRYLESLPASVARVTSQAVAAEAYTWLRYKRGHRVAATWLDVLDSSRAEQRLMTIYHDEVDGENAEMLLRRYRDQALSYVDALTLASAQRYNVGAIFGFDRHLALTGIPLLPGPRASGR
jgi:predicted nucleic acid-binding protein